MDRMMSYCAQNSNDSIEACVDYDPSENGDTQYSNDNDTNVQSELKQDLIRQCDNYRAQIKRQEEEINSYRQHIELIEEEYSRLSNHLAAAEKNVRQNEKKLCSYQDTIGSLKNELDSFYNLEKSIQETNTTLSDVSLSFSNDSDLKMFHKDNSVSSAKNFPGQINESENLQENIIFLDTYKNLCLENMELKNQNQVLQTELHRLKKDNEDFQSILWNSKSEFCKKSQDFSNSTPIKNLNFISYQALNLANNSFSIDEDYENIVSDRNFLPSHVTNANNLKNMDNTENTKTFNGLKIKDVEYIENQEIPSCILKDELTHMKTIHLSKCLLTESMKNSVFNEISSIEDEKFPRLEIPDSSTSDKSLKANSKEESIKTSTFKIENSPEALCKESEANAELYDLPVFTHHFLVFLFFSNFINKLKKDFERLSIRNLFNSCHLRLPYFATIALLFLIWIFISISFPNIYFQSRLVPFYSIQEILMDILNRFCLTRHF